MHELGAQAFRQGGLDVDAAGDLGDSCNKPRHQTLDRARSEAAFFDTKQIDDVRPDRVGAAERFNGQAWLKLHPVIPIMQAFTANKTLAIGGTALLIVVSVVLDLLKKIDAQVSMREY